MDAVALVVIAMILIVIRQLTKKDCGVYIIEAIIFPLFGVSLVIAASLLLCFATGINVPEKITRTLAGIAVAPIAAFAAIAGITLIGRVITW